MKKLAGRNRPLLVFAPAEDDPRYVKQRHALQDRLAAAGMIDRTIVVVAAFEAGPGREGDAPIAEAAAATLRRTYKVGRGEFAAVLVGKDGGEKHRWAEPVAAQEVFGKVDAMPMRQQEVRDKHR